MRRPYIAVWCALAVVVLGLWCSAVSAQTVRTLDPVRRDSTVSATAVIGYPQTFARSRVRVTVSVQIGSTTAKWVSATRTGPWVAADSQFLVAKVITPPALTSWASDSTEGYYQPLCAWLKFIDGKIRRASNSPVWCDQTPFGFALTHGPGGFYAP